MKLHTGLVNAGLHLRPEELVQARFGAEPAVATRGYRPTDVMTVLAHLHHVQPELLERRGVVIAACDGRELAERAKQREVLHI